MPEEIKHNYIDPQNDCERTDEIICPYCGKNQLDPLEFIRHEEQEREFPVECGECGEKFLLQFEMDIKYTSRCSECDWVVSEENSSYTVLTCKRCGNRSCKNKT